MTYGYMVNIIRWCLAGFLLILPFQRNIGIISSGLGMMHFISYLDEIVVVAFAPLAIIKLYKDMKFKNQFCLAMLIQMGLFVIVGLIEGFINANAPSVTSVGIFDYLKNFVVIIIYFTFFTDADDFKKIFRLVMAAAIIIGIIAFMQEIWAMISVYVLKKDISDPFNYIFNYMDINLTTGYWRFGMFRAPSLTTTSIISGLYCLLVFNIYMWTTKKINIVVAVSLLSGVFTSISRIVYTGFMLVAGLQMFRGRRWMVLFLIPVMFLIFFMGHYRDFNVAGFINNEDFLSTKEAETEEEQQRLMEIEVKRNDSPSNKSSEERLREYSRDKAVEIWKDHPLWGVGPGMFGSVISLKFNSHIYNEYNFSMINYLKFLGNIDNFGFSYWLKWELSAFQFLLE